MASMLDGSEPMKIARGRCLPAPDSEKWTFHSSSSMPTVGSLGIIPSDWMP